jgi:ABC-type amino acid transport system permease subunit
VISLHHEGGEKGMTLFVHALGRSATSIVSFLVNAAKGTPIASFIGAPELLSAPYRHHVLLERQGHDLLPAAGVLYPGRDGRGLAVRPAARLARKPRGGGMSLRELWSDFVPSLLAAMVTNFEISFVALALGLALGLPLAMMRFYGGRASAAPRRP